MFPLITADDTWALWAILLAGAAFGFYAENTRVGRRLSGAVLTMAFTFTLSNLGVIPATGVEAYDVVWGYLVPLAIPLLLLRADLARILREAGPTLAAFTVGALGTVLGTIVAYHAVPLGEEGWKLAGIFCMSPAMVHQMRDLGFRLMAYGSDMNLVQNAAAEAVKASS